MQTPVLGFVGGANQSELQSLLGIPGASALGEPLALPAGVTGVHFAPGQNYALLASNAGSSLGLMTFQGTEVGAVVAICGAVSQPGIVAFSPGASAAALYSMADGLQVITGLPDSPKLARVVPDSELPDEVRFLAVADDSVTLLEGTAHSAIYLLPQLGAPRLLYTAGDLQGMAFVPKTNDLVAFDRAAGAVFQLQEVDGASSYGLLADGLTGLDGNVFLQTSRTGAIVASTSSSTLWGISLQSLGVQNIHLSGPPQMLQPLRTSGDYLLYYQTGFPAWILDSNHAAAVVSLVPACAVAPRHPKPVKLSTTRSLEGDQNRQPEVLGQPGFGTGCTDVPEPTPAPKSPPRPTS